MLVFIPIAKHVPDEYFILLRNDTNRYIVIFYFKFYVKINFLLFLFVKCESGLFKAETVKMYVAVP